MKVSIQQKKYSFEGYEFDGPNDADKYLTNRYSDYMTPPEKKNRQNVMSD